MNKFKDLTGQRFGRLTILERADNNKWGKSQWLCLCECGTIKILISGDICFGRVQSCGCLKRELIVERNTIHGDACSNGKKTKEYLIWVSMKARCLNPNNKDYQHYGGRGIGICDSWIEGYENFITDMGRCPKGLTLDRINTDGNYDPKNCRWTTWEKQNHNSHHNVWIEAKGLKMIVSDWIKHLGIATSSFYYWVKKGYSHKEAVFYFLQKGEL